MKGSTIPLQGFPSFPLAIQIIPYGRGAACEGQALETMMQRLVLSAHHPVTLEITGECQKKRFILRATCPVALEHAKAQLRLAYPQADIRPLTWDDDPWQSHLNETVSVVELRAGAPSYFPYRAWATERLPSQYADPILGVLASLSVPHPLRAITQIALVPAPPAWSRPSLRKAYEHPLEPERLEQRRSMTQGATS